MKIENFLVIDRKIKWAFIVLFTINVSQSEEKKESSFLGKSGTSISLILTESGFVPDQISFYEKEWVSLNLANTSKEDSCFVLPEKNIHLSVHSGKVVGTQIYFEHSGQYSFYCPLYQMKGTLHVLKKTQTPERILASTFQGSHKKDKSFYDRHRQYEFYFKSKDEYWIPREKETHLD
jgi:hypothetical protein